MKDALVPPPRPVLRCDHGEEAYVKQSRYLSTAARAYSGEYLFFFFSIRLFIFSPLDCVNVIETSINFAELRPV
jgi:hypothetical protein